MTKGSPYMNEIKIGKKTIGENRPVFIVAELSCNHLQNYGLAKKTIYAIKESGADAVKLQTFSPEAITLNSKKKYFQINQGTPWDGKNLYKLYREAYTPWEWHAKLKKLAEDLGLICFSSALDKNSVDFLERLSIPVYKVPSFEITDIPLIEYIASKRKPIIISTGIATLSDIKEALKACKRMRNDKIILLKCTSSYPAKLEEMNLRAISDFKKRFKTIVGLSDHTAGIIAPVAAVALGAKVIEKHFLLDKKLKSLDAAFSLDPKEFKKMSMAIRDTEVVLGKPDYSLSINAKKNRKFCRSLFAIKDIKKGEALTQENIKSIRPGFGLEPKYYSYVLGRKAVINIHKGMPLRWKAIGVKKWSV